MRPVEPEERERRQRERASRRQARRADPAHLTRGELTATITWLRVVPPRAWSLLTRLWREDRARLAVMAAGVLAAVLVLSLVGAGQAEIVGIVTTVALGALVLAVSWDHRTAGSVVVTVLALSLLGSLAGPRWSPQPAQDALVPSTTDTRIGGAVTTADVGTYAIRATEVSLPQKDGTTVTGLLRQPLGADGEPLTGTVGVVFMHGAGTHTWRGFREQAEALSGAGATTLVPDKPTQDYTLTERDYELMADNYAYSISYLRSLPTVKAGGVGVYAESEGGFPGVIAAGRDADLAFLVLASAPVVQLRQQATYAAGTYLSRVGVPGPLLTAVARLLGTRELPRGAFRYADFDATSYQQRVTAPVLMLYGTADSSMPLVQGPATIWRDIQVAGNTQLTVRYYADANHGLKLGNSTDGVLAPGVARDLARWVTGLPITASAEPRVAGATPVQDFWAQAPGRTRWYASGDLMLAGILTGLALLVASGAGWALGQLPRLVGRRGMHLPDPVGRWAAALALAVLAAWVLYLAYVGMVARLALSYSSNPWISYGGWLAAQLTALLAVVILVKLVGRVLLVRGHVRHGRDEGGRWLTLPSAAVLAAAVTGSVLLLAALAYWGLFPMLG
ncbi:alpha/beta hydrolase family protein [Actinomyces respiraculi]|uniref:alpha/beta hydrolase family protein n=1 Tax=Actinomyces respiraculi TaxID=2744574 RepID=UPI001F1D1071|nr:alpha/beta hydrolase [Actinomyces respiraculi]